MKIKVEPTYSRSKAGGKEVWNWGKF